MRLLLNSEIYFLIQLYSGLCEFKHKRSSGKATEYLPLRDEIERHDSLPRVMAKLRNLSAVTEVPIASQKTSFSWPIEDEVSRNKKLLHASSSVPDKKASGMDSFRYQLARSARRSVCTKMGPLSAKCSLSEKMSQLRQPRHGRSNKKQTCIGVLNQRHRVTQSRGAVDTLRNEEIHKQSDSSTARHWQTLLDNALLRRKSQPPNEESSERLWSCTNSESDKAVCLSSSGSVDDLQVSFSSDTSYTSDSSKLSSLSIAANDRWRMGFKKVFYRNFYSLIFLVSVILYHVLVNRNIG